MRGIVTAHRNTMQALLTQRTIALEALRNAAPEEREALMLTLRTNMREMQQTQRELAKAIRDEIKARRDQQRKAGGGG